MAPSKRTTRGPQCNSSVSSEQQKKVHVYLGDFETQRKNRRVQILKDGKNLEKQIDAFFTRETMKIPSDVRKMTLRAYIACDGNVNAAVERNLETIEEEVERSVTTVIEKRKPVAIKKPQPAASAGKGTRDRSSKTPAFTPKVDPRLPITPATTLRKPRLGELLLSKRGSLVVCAQAAATEPPIPEEVEEAKVTVTMPNGKAFQVGENSDLASIPDLDSNSRTQLGALWKKCANLFNF